MSKLKTLKDLEITHRGREREDSDKTMMYNHSFIGKDIQLCWPNQLRAEAIKWYKDIWKTPQNKMQCKKACLMFDPSVKELEAIAKYIKHFFNLTEQDLEDW